MSNGFLRVPPCLAMATKIRKDGTDVQLCRGYVGQRRIILHIWPQGIFHVAESDDWLADPRVENKS